MDNIEMDAELQRLLTLFDESGFVPTTCMPDPEEAATEWKTHLVNYIQTMYKKIESLKDENKRLKLMLIDQRKETARAITNSIEYNLIKVLGHIKRNYGVEVKNDD